MLGYKKVTLIELEKSFYSRRPQATFNLDDPEIDIKFQYFLDGAKSNLLEVTGTKIKGLKLHTDFAVIYAYRLPELILMQMNPDVKFIYIQHGYYPDLITRKLTQVFKKFDRIMLYSKMLVEALFGGLKFAVALDMVRLWTIRGFYASRLSEPDLCVLIDKSWQSFHERKLGWVNSKYITKPFYEPKNIKHDSLFDYQYICQSLVEDSRLTQKSLISTINRYIKERDIRNLAVITHPRSDKEIYQDLDTNVSFVEDCCFDVPAFGHYSSLMLYLAENGVAVDVCESDDLLIPTDFKQKLKSARNPNSPKRYTNNKLKSFLNEELKSLIEKD